MSVHVPVRRPRSRCALSMLSLAAASVALQATGLNPARANSGTQPPLGQYQAGSEQTQSAPITNPGFEQPGVAGSVATGWTNVDDSGNPGTMFVDQPDPAHLPNPASAIGAFSAKA